MGLAYVIRRNDALASMALEILSKQSPVHALTDDEQIGDVLAGSAGTILAAIFWCDGIYPSNHYRILRAKDLERRNFVIPGWLPKWGEMDAATLKYVALQPPSNKNVHMRENFSFAMLGLHTVLTQPIQPPSTKAQHAWKTERRGSRHYFV